MLSACVYVFVCTLTLNPFKKQVHAAACLRLDVRYTFNGKQLSMLEMLSDLLLHLIFCQLQFMQH